METQNRPSIESIDFSRFNMTEEQVKWLQKARPGEVNAFLRGEIGADYLHKSINQDMENRHITGHAGLHEYYTFGDED